ncbi:hypothetical protein Bmayo_05430 (plasmid) [Borreliella mayonii]|uniref:YqaJ viral recombinase domain-containing protein n=1 Tax=Borreliella mayonii TaxID=1674146 RepID=A0AAC9KYS1_9SPIR|nr:DUF244 domain-containing protein [Borreliella mayonii]APS99098.1 hypothetical protein A7X70_04555 [Borreliella mayonii]APT00218.1 hypothetical protein Bmayo_05430 [Borreliella mayonii]
MENLLKNNNPQENIQGDLKMINVNQQSFTGCEIFEEKSSPIKEKSKLSKMGKKLPGISSQECFRFNRNIDFSVQRNKLDKYGASEIGNILVGGAGLKDLMMNRLLKYFGISMPFEENLYMLKGKELENLGFREFVKAQGDNIDILYKNKYANGVDKYNYFKKMGSSETLVGSTIDGWFINNTGDLELLEIKSSDSNYMSSAIAEYNENGNFLNSKYFFKYYVQAQMQLACTGLEYCNLFFLIDAAPVNCKIKRNEALISKVFEFVGKCELEIINLKKDIYSNYREEYLMAHNFNKDTFIKLVEDLVERSDFYNSGNEFDWKIEFAKYLDCIDLEIKDRQVAEKVAYYLMEINSEREGLNKIQNENKKREKSYKDSMKMKIDIIKNICPLIEHVNYRFGEFVFILDSKKRAISDRLKVLFPISDPVSFPSNIAFANSVGVPM